MKFKHTVHLAIAINARIVDNAGAPVSDFAAPVQYLWFWLPGWLWRFWILDCRFWILGSLGKSPAKGRPIQNPKSKIQNYLAGWRDDLALIGLAAWLLLRDWRLANDCAYA